VIGIKRQVSEIVQRCQVDMNELPTYVDLKVLPLGSYDVLIGMDWLEPHGAKVGCYSKNFDCIDASRIL
jgi:hypothetical protein